MSPLIIAIASFVAVAALVGSVAVMFRSKPLDKAEDRLDLITASMAGSSVNEKLLRKSKVLSEPLDDSPGLFESLLQRIGNFDLLFEQADTSLTVPKLLLVCGILGGSGIVVGLVLRISFAILPVLGILMSLMPFAWLLWRRKRRFKAFASQLPDALEMLSRALRAGQSLGFGLNSIAEEMANPISKEFGRVFEEQNLGISLEDSLNSITKRIPNLDLKFFATAVILQRQTGGDLAEILDKIGHLIRERFKIWGQIQALTGEGRLSGIVLLALPPTLLGVVYYLNHDYIMVLFTDELGRRLLAGAVILQILGALVIRKIIDIKV